MKLLVVLSYLMPALLLGAVYCQYRWMRTMMAWQRRQDQFMLRLSESVETFGSAVVDCQKSLREILKRELEDLKASRN